MPEMRNLTEYRYLLVKYYVFFIKYYVFSMASESTIAVAMCFTRYQISRC